MKANKVPRAPSSTTLRRARPRRFDAAARSHFAEQLLLSGSPEKIVASLTRSGFRITTIQRELRRLASDPIFQAACRVSRLFGKLNSLADALAAMSRQLPPAASVNVCENISPAEFFRDYYHPNRPVVVRGLMRNWRALRIWSPRYFSENYGRHTVEISHRRSANPAHELQFSAHRSTVRLDDYIEWITKGGSTNDYYLTARNRLLERKEFKTLFSDFTCPKGILEPSTLRNGANLWLGPAGTVTRLHHDDANNLFGQIYGRKHIKLISPFELTRVYNEVHVYSSVDLEKIDYRKFPLMKKVKVIDIILHPGEFLLIPIGWWHWVKSLDVSISLSFTNFRTAQLPVWDFRRGIDGAC